MTQLLFVNWDYRPAVLYDDSVKGAFAAFAVLKPHGPWQKVDRSDVWHTSRVMSEEKWRAYFEPEFGPLDLSKLPPLKEE